MQLKQSYDARISGFEAALNARAEDIAALRQELEAKGDYDTVKSELNVLKSVEFGSDVVSMDSEKLETLLLRTVHHIPMCFGKTIPKFVHLSLLLCVRCILTLVFCTDNSH